ncbi:MAG: DUF370 domain-containing protein [Ruminococcus sp.]|nr:DUF370 domain-containing protein [Ruminococcus sp.]MDE6784230.1 DUF370 domain-containing protein [Ruminococcus sp.]
MYLHIGNGYSVDVREIIGIFDMDNTTVTGTTKKLLDKAQKEKRLFLATYELPKTFIITKKRVYISQLAASTLKKRLANGGGFI